MNEDFRTSAPEALQPAPFNIPSPVETTLKNGLRVVVFENRRLPLVSLRLAFPTGEIYDPAEKTGLTSALASMLNEGTLNRTSRQIADEIERLGASISVSSSSDNFVAAGSGLSLYLDDVLDLISDMVLFPNFPEDELALYKANTIEGLKFQRSQAGFLADEQVSRIMFGDHPYSVVSPQISNVENISRNDLIEHHRKLLTAGNAVMIVVGDVDAEDLISKIESRFGSWSSETLVDREFASLPERDGVTLTIVDRPGSAQSNIALANLALKRTDPDYFSAIVMNQVLGAGASARLFMNLREEKGYTYGAYSSFDARRLAGIFEATAEVRTPVTGDSLKEFFYELNRIRTEIVPEHELADAKNFLTGVFPLRAETQEGLTNLITSQKMYGLPDDYLQTYREKISAVNAEEVLQAAKKYITPDKMALVIVGDASEILTQVRDFSDVIDIFDTNNNPRNISDYEGTSDIEPESISGEWKLLISMAGQEISIDLSLQQDENVVSGKMVSPFGDAEIIGGKITGKRLFASVETEMQGQIMNFSINGEVSENEMKGTIDTGMEGFPPLEFEGKRI
ncbi:MAG: insulinase family protein [Pyrinomonadaceae bacterium]|nr:insulinase family protein [Pyrinomonadaceae bacterium]